MTDPILRGGMADESDPNAPQFAQFAEGPVEINGIWDYQTVDTSTGLPYFKESGGRPITRLWLRLLDGEKGPIMSADAAQLSLFVLALAGPQALALLEGKNKLSAEFLLLAKQLANCQAPQQAGQQPAKQTAYVNSKGWVANVTGMQPPLNTLYRFKLVGFRNLDGGDIPSFQESSWDQQIFLNFQLVGDMWGHPTPYDGLIESVRASQAFDGFRQLADENGSVRAVPSLRKTETGARHVAATRMLAVVECLWPESANYIWETDPLKSAYGINEAENPLPVIVDKIVRGGRSAIGEYLENKNKKVYLALESFKVVPDNAGVPVFPVPSAPLRSGKLGELARYIDVQCAALYNSSAFLDNTTLALSPKGVEWCQKYVAGTWTKLNLPADRKLASLTEDQAAVLLSELDRIGRAAETAF